jgi:voltage-gated potassium channel
MPEVLASGALAGAQRRSVRRIVYGLAALALVLSYGVVGYMAQGWTAGDALYMVVITVSGVGFTEVHDLSTTGLRAHTMTVIVFGILATGYTVAALFQFLTESELEHLVGHQRVRRQIETLSGHTIVVGFGRMGGLICSELKDAEVPFVLIENAHERHAEIERHAYLHVDGDATDEKVLLDAGLQRARALVTAIASDAANVFITLTARELAPDVQIVARAESPSTQKKLMQAGANHVVLPAAIGAHRIVSMLTNPSAVEFAELVTHRSSLAIEMDEVTVTDGGPFSGRTLRDVDIGRRTGVIVIAVKRVDGRVEFPPTGDQPFAVGDSIVLLGRRANLAHFREQFGG